MSISKRIAARIIRDRMMEESRKKKMRENWTKDEKNLLVRLINERIDIIESKGIGSTTNSMKNEAWKRIWERFVVENRRPRSLDHIRDQWRRMKHEISKSKKLQSNTSGNTSESATEECHQSQEHNVTERLECTESTEETAKKDRFSTEQITNCVLAERIVRMRQLKEEYCIKIEMAKELHCLESNNKKLQAELVELENIIKKRKFNGVV